MSTWQVQFAAHLRPPSPLSFVSNRDVVLTSFGVTPVFVFLQMCKESVMF